VGRSRCSVVSRPSEGCRSNVNLTLRIEECLALPPFFFPFDNNAFSSSLSPTVLASGGSPGYPKVSSSSEDRTTVPRHLPSFLPLSFPSSRLRFFFSPLPLRVWLPSSPRRSISESIREAPRGHVRTPFLFFPFFAFFSWGEKLKRVSGPPPPLPLHSTQGN